MEISAASRFAQTAERRRSGERGNLQAIIALAHTLNLKTAAEGVETASQAEFLAGTGCDYLRGFLFSPPLPASQFTDCREKGDFLASKPQQQTGGETGAAARG